MNKDFYLKKVLDWKNILFKDANYELAAAMRGLEIKWFIENDKIWNDELFLSNLKDVIITYSNISNWESLLERELIPELREYKINLIIR